jgi:hypothetical protein
MWGWGVGRHKMSHEVMRCHTVQFVSPLTTGLQTESNESTSVEARAILRCGSIVTSFFPSIDRIDAIQLRVAFRTRLRWGRVVLYEFTLCTYKIHLFFPSVYSATGLFTLQIRNEGRSPDMPNRESDNPRPTWTFRAGASFREYQRNTPQPALSVEFRRSRTQLTSSHSESSQWSQWAHRGMEKAMFHWKITVRSWTNNDSAATKSGKTPREKPTRMLVLN